MATAAKLKSTDKADKADKTDKAEKGEGATKGKKSKKKLIMIVVPVLLIAMVGGYLFLGSGGEEAEPKPVPGPVLALDAVTINLAAGHYLKLKIALQATATAGEELDGNKALDLAVSEFSYKPIEELASNKARQKVKEHLLKEVVEAYEGEVMDIYFTEFVMQ